MSNTNESALWFYIKKGMGNRWDASRHEDMLSLGVPDISFGCNGVGGWIELKVINNLSTNPDSHFHTGLSPAQRQWLTRRGRRCPVFLLIKTNDRFGNKNYFLIPSGRIPKDFSYAILFDVSVKAWAKRISFPHFERAICRRYSPL